MLYDAGIAARFANIAALEDTGFGALAWWYPATAYARAVRKGEVL